MSHIIFDIETIGMPWDQLDQDTQNYLLKFADTEDKQKEIKETLGLNPLTGEIVAIGLYDSEKDIKCVFFQAPEGDIEDKTFENEIYYYVCSEKGLLEKFWATVAKYNTVITFNGREFDCPYIMLRSAFHKIKPSRNLLPNRYYTDSHIDLLDQLRFYGATRKFNMDFYCKRFGIKSPKSEGVSGLQVGEMFLAKKYKEIATYCIGDVVATAKLFDIWNEYIKI